MFVFHPPAVIYHALSHKEAKEHDVQVQSFKGGLGAGYLTAKMAQNLPRKTGLAVLSSGLLLIFTVSILGSIKFFCADIFLCQAPFLGYQSQL